MNLIDANVFIRYLIGDDATKQQKSREPIFASGEKIDLSDAIAVAYVRNGLVDGIYSFDRKLDNLTGANRIGLYARMGHTA